MVNVWETLESSLPAIIGQLRASETDLPKHELQDLEGGTHLMDFLIFEGRPINGDIVTSELARRAYFLPETLDKTYDSFVSEGLAVKNADDTYSITRAGESFFMDYYSIRLRAYEPHQILPDDDFEDYTAFMRTGYEAGKLAELPENLPGATLGYKFYSQLGEQGGQLGEALGWINLFELYRDDCHMFAWRNAGFTGIQIEALSRMWQDETLNTVEAVAETLAFRRNTQADYQVALDEMVAKNWLQVDEGIYSLTDDGKAIRQKIEDETNTIYEQFIDNTYSAQEKATFVRLVNKINQSTD